MTRKTQKTAKKMEGDNDNEFFFLLTTNLTNETKSMGIVVQLKEMVDSCKAEKRRK